MAYAKDTSVAVAATEMAIKSLLRKAGADSIAIMDSSTRAIVAFQMEGRSITFRLPLPDRNAREFTFATFGARGEGPRSPEAAMKAWEQGCRSRWRGLLLCIKAKLESIEAGIESFEEAFLPHITLPDGDTVGDKVLPEMRAQLAGQPMRPLLGGPDHG